MAQILEMPKLSDTMTEGSIVRWLKKEGEKISAGLPIVEVETDKSNMEYESPVGGVLLKIIVGDGQKCPLQAPIAVIGKEGENWEEELKKYKDKLASRGAAGTKTPSTSSAKAEAATPAPSAKVEPAEVTPAPSAKPEPTAPVTTQNDAVKPVDAQSNGPIKASPLAKKIAADLGINLSTVKGSGPNERIVQRDLANMQAQPAAGALAQSTSFVRGVAKKIPLTNMRKTIAQRLTQSVVTAPHFYLKISINMTNLLESRKTILANAPADQKFSVNDMIIYFVSRALVKHPEINSAWQDDHIAEFPYVDMSVAVALPQGGLITPVVRNAHALSVFQIAKETTRLIGLARSSKLQPSDYSGGTFSISNLGMSGVEDFTAIINPPQAAILAVGSTIPTPVVSSSGAVVVEQRMTVSLSCDHRVIDGLMGANFLQTLKHYFEHPVSLLFTP